MKTLLSTFLALALITVGEAHAQQGALGITMSDNSSGGVLITNVVANSPAARIGLRSGDRILAINNQPTSNYQDVVRIIQAGRPNASVELSVARGAWRGNLTAQLGSAAEVFSQNPQYVPTQRYLPASIPSVYAAPQYGYGGFPRDWIDNGNRGVQAAYGGGGW